MNTSNASEGRGSSTELPYSGRRSWWFDEAMASEAQTQPCPPLQGQHTCDVAIVGGGYTGLWTAISLKKAKPGLSVSLIERDVCGSGASGKNGGKVHGYWSSLPHLVEMVGERHAWEMARLGSKAQVAIRNFVKNCGTDVWWREAGGLKVSAAPAQDAKITSLLAGMKAVGATTMARGLRPDQVSALCKSPVFRGGIFYPEEATVHPARLARALRSAALKAGVRIFEHTPMTDLQPGAQNKLYTPQGSLSATSVALATNVDLLKFRAIRQRFMAFSSYALMTEPNQEALQSMNWEKDMSVADSRSFLHYFRRTPDGRILMGSGSGPIAYGAQIGSKSFLDNQPSFERTKKGLLRLLPEFARTSIAGQWGAAIDVSSDRLPSAGSLTSQVFYVCGFSGHGVNPTYILGRCMSSMILGKVDKWSTSPFCTRKLPGLPPEPFRYLGGALIRSAILDVEAAEEMSKAAPTTARLVSSLPQMFNLKIGTR